MERMPYSNDPEISQFLHKKYRDQLPKKSEGPNVLDVVSTVDKKVKYEKRLKKDKKVDHFPFSKPVSEKAMEKMVKVYDEQIARAKNKILKKKK